MVAALGPASVREGLLGTAAFQRQSLRFKHADRDVKAIGLPLNHPAVQESLVAPVASLAHVYGWICLSDKLGGAEFSTEDEKLLGILTAQIGRIYENGRLYREIQQHASLLEMEIDQRKITQHALTESESLFRQLAENIREAFFLIDAESKRIVYISPGYEEIWGRSCASLYEDNKSWIKGIHPDDLERTVISFREGLSGGNFEYEYRIVRPDGSVRWVNNQGFPVRDATGKVVRYAGLSMDITERKRTAIELQESGRRFSNLSDNVEMMSVMVDIGGRITYVNDYLLRVTGWRREEVMGQNWFERFIQVDRLKTIALFAKLLVDDPTALHIENTIQTRTGESRLIRWTNTVLRSSDGEIIGTASLGDDITEQKAASDRITHLNRVHAILSGINGLIVRVRDRQQLFTEACRIAVRKGGFPMVWVGIVDPASGHLVPVASEGLDSELLAGINKFYGSAAGGPQGNSMAVQALTRKMPVISNDSINDPRVVFAAKHRDAGVRSVAVLPLVIDETAVGVVALYAGEVNFFQEEELLLLFELVADVAFAIDYIDKQERLNYLAYNDVLTGLANQSFFHNRLVSSLHARNGEIPQIAVVMLDIERFRQINVTFGRASGDELLRDIGGRLIMANQSVARIGADMFGLILRGTQTASDINRMLEGIISTCFSALFQLGGENVRVACRAGVAVFPVDGLDADALLRNAEAALRRSKGSSERIVFYTAEMNARVAETLAIETRLRRAVEQREFVLHYQPKIALSSGEIVGLEALIRWNDPEHGLVAPNKFIPVLEETGMIVEAGRWVVEQAFVDLRRWSARGIDVPRVAVNVSAIQLHRKDFVETMVEEIRRGGDMPDWLELEVTESIVMSDVDACTRKLSILRGMGVSIAIDDFGTGYSSLSYLGRLPLDSLKIDRSFISGLTNSSESSTIVSTIIALAHGLKLKAIAEGVETEEQASALANLHCDQVQGYLYSRPIPVEAMETFLLAGSSGTIMPPHSKN